MKGIILAGGAGTRLYPLTIVTSKQLLPVYNKPMIFYPLSTLMLAKIREVLIISTPEDTPRISQLLGDGSQFGMKLEYAVQEKPEGLAQAFTIGKDFIGDDSCAMILGDNIFYGNGLNAKLSAAVKTAQKGQATIFGYYVEDPERFGIMEFEKVSDDKDEGLKVLSVEEKPANPKSNYAIVGLESARWLRRSNPPPEESWRSPLSTICTWKRTVCTRSSSAAALPGRTPARSTACGARPTLSA